MPRRLPYVALLAASCVTACSEHDRSEPDQASVSEYNVVADADVKSNAEAPSFDCGKSASEVEDLVCSDPVLVRLDKELARLHALAATGPYVTAQSLAELKALQRGWVKGRNDCWKAEDKRDCVVSAYAMRILELRQDNANARSADSEGISSGPVAFQCEGLDFGIGAVFINSDPGLVYLRWLDHGVALSQVETASGAKYQGNSFDGTYSLWTKGNDALLTRPGQPEAKCRQDEIG